MSAYNAGYSDGFADGAQTALDAIRSYLDSGDVIDEGLIDLIDFHIDY